MCGIKAAILLCVTVSSYTVKVEQEEDYDASSRHVYSYKYNVQQPHRDLHFQVSESGDPDRVTGRYMTNLPDGRIQIVTYQVHPLEGYKAQVTYSGTAVYPDSPQYQPSPYGPPVRVRGLSSKYSRQPTPVDEKHRIASKRLHKYRDGARYDLVGAGSHNVYSYKQRRKIGTKVKKGEIKEKYSFGEPIKLITNRYKYKASDQGHKEVKNEKFKPSTSFVKETTETADVTQITEKIVSNAIQKFDVDLKYNDTEHYIEAVPTNTNTDPNVDYQDYFTTETTHQTLDTTETVPDNNDANVIHLKFPLSDSNADYKQSKDKSVLPNIYQFKISDGDANIEQEILEEFLDTNEENEKISKEENPATVGPVLKRDLLQEPRSSSTSSAQDISLLITVSPVTSTASSSSSSTRPQQNTSTQLQDHDTNMTDSDGNNNEFYDLIFHEDFEKQKTKTRNIKNLLKV